MTPFQRKQTDLMRQMESRLASDANAATIVPMQTDYPGNPQMCLSVNTFLPQHIASQIQKTLIQPLKAIDENQYYYPNASLHITLHSIRIIHDPPTFTKANISHSKELLTYIVPRELPFPFTLNGVLSLPTSVSVIALVTPRYDTFIRSLRNTFVHAGIPDDKTYFTNEMVFANTTVCRYTHKPTQKFLQKIQELQNTSFGSFTATETMLVETNAVCHPAKTTILGRYEFQRI